jgi:hypothetical protein
MRLTDPLNLYTHKSEAGAMHEGRKDKWSGNTMTPGALLRYHKTTWSGFNQVKPDWSNRPMQQTNYTIEFKSYFPSSMLFNEDDFNTRIKRFETTSFWHLSFQEVIRHLELISAAQMQDTYAKLKEIVDSFEDEIKEAFKKYVNMIVKDGDFSFEHFSKYVKDHERSASPFDGLKWRDILDDPGKLKQAYVAVNQWIIKFNDALPKLLKFKRPLIKIDYVYPALRARQAEYELQSYSNELVRIACSKIRDRKAGGVKGMSQIEYPIYKLPVKKKIYDECFYNLISKIAGCSLIPIVTHGAAFYKQVFENKPQCYDIRNAEKFVGSLLSFLPINVDLGHPEYPDEIAGEMYSGIGPTRPVAEIVVGVLINYLRNELGLPITSVFLGGDNFGFAVELDCKEQNLDLFMTNEDTILGALPIEEHFGPLSLVTDSVNHRANVPVKWQTLTWTQRFQYILRPLQVIVDNDLFKPGSCKRKIDWVIERKELGEEEIYSKESLNRAIGENLEIRDSFLDLFSDEIAFVKRFIPVHDNPENPTDAHLPPTRRS